MRLVRLQLGMVRILDEDVAASQLSRRAVAEIVDHGNGGVLVGHLQKRLPFKNIHVSLIAIQIDPIK